MNTPPVIGNKAANLQIMRDRFGLAVPRFEILPFAQLFRDFDHIRAKLNATAGKFLTGKTKLEATSAEIGSALAELEIDQQVITHLSSLGFRRVSYRTSAALEDSSETSFAGQYESFLDQELDAETISKRARDCFASVVSPRVLNYAKDRGLKSFDADGSMIIQEMFFGHTSGVLFSENGNGQIELATVANWQNKVVEGEDAETILVSRDQISKSALDWQVKQLCEASLRLEQVFGRPVDMEWSFDDRSVAFLQFRPITTANRSATFEWDSTNISENYPGITLPLTYSVIRQFYGAVYQNFFKMLGASQRQLSENSPIFDNMLGYLSGRVHYRISNWYEALRLLPGKRNQEYFESMLNPVKKRGAGTKTKLDLKSIVTVLRFLWLLANAQRISKRFAREISQKIALYDSLPVDYTSAPVIVNTGKRIRIEVLNDWATTILNDMRLMIFHGILKRIYANNDSPQDYLVLIQGLTEKASIKPLVALAALGKKTRLAMDAEDAGSVAALIETKSWSTLQDDLRLYVSDFGARTPGELKLENPRISDDPTAILELALNAAASEIDATPNRSKRAVIWPAKLPWILRPLVLSVAKQTRVAIDWRERFRFNRAQTFNLSRKSFDALGNIFSAEQLISDARDIYWLTDQEIDDIVNTHTPTYEVRTLIADRKKAFARFAKEDQSLAVHGAGLIPGMHLTNVASNQNSDGLSGNGVAPGLVTAEAIVVTEFDSSIDVRGKVLVVHYVDPGWTLLFTQAAAIIAERGNALSHAAIIAREIGIPCVVAAVGATTTLKTGQTVTINGTSGVIELG